MQDILMFFDKMPGALSLYEAFEARVLAEVPDVTIKIAKTQISFSNKRMFACASMLPVRKAKDRPKTFLTVTFGLREQKVSPRIDAATEAAPNRWTHHVMVTSAEELDEELMGWIKEAAAFSAAKR